MNTTYHRKTPLLMGRFFKKKPNKCSYCSIGLARKKKDGLLLYSDSSGLAELILSLACYSEVSCQVRGMDGYHWGLCEMSSQ